MAKKYVTVQFWSALKNISLFTFSMSACNTRTCSFFQNDVHVLILPMTKDLFVQFYKWLKNQNVNPFPHIDAFCSSAADDFWKHCGKRRNYSKWAISPYTRTFSMLFSNYTFINRDFCQLDIFKVVSYKCVVWEKG